MGFAGTLTTTLKACVAPKAGEPLSVTTIFIAFDEPPCAMVGRQVKMPVFVVTTAFAGLLSSENVSDCAGISVSLALLVKVRIAPAIIEATVQRSRPVILTALAAVLAFIPLTHSVFWGSMAYVLIGGTAVGTVLTLAFLPALYAIWFRVRLVDSTASSPLAMHWVAG